MKLWVTFATSIELNSFTVSAAYNFSTSGAGTYTFKSIPKLQVIGLNGTVETISDINVDNTRTVSITVTDNLSKRQFNPNDPFKVNCNDDKKHVTIAYGLAEAKELASIAAAYIDHDQGKSQVYKDYFGSNPTSSVIKNFAAIAKVDVVSSKISLYCSDPSKICSPGNAAYFLGSEGVTHLHFCDAFFRYHPRNELCKNGNTVDDQNIFGGATLFELSYGLLSTDDIAHRCPDGRNLGNKDKIKNAANYEVSAQTPRGMPRVRVLTWGHDLPSASRPRSTKEPSADEIVWGRGFRMAYVCMDSRIVPVLGTVFRKHFVSESNLLSGAIEQAIHREPCPSSSPSGHDDARKTLLRWLRIQK